MVVRLIPAKEHMQQKELFLGGQHEETPRRKYIRAFAKAGKLEKASEFFKDDFLRLLRAYGGGVQNIEVQSFSDFGRDVLGEALGLQIIGECIDQVVGEMEVVSIVRERDHEAVC